MMALLSRRFFVLPSYLGAYCMASVYIGCTLFVRDWLIYLLFSYQKNKKMKGWYAMWNQTYWVHQWCDMIVHLKVLLEPGRPKVMCQGWMTRLYSQKHWWGNSLLSWDLTKDSFRGKQREHISLATRGKAGVKGISNFHHATRNYEQMEEKPTNWLCYAMLEVLQFGWSKCS